LLPQNQLPALQEQLVCLCSPKNWRQLARVMHGQGCPLSEVLLTSRSLDFLLRPLLSHHITLDSPFNTLFFSNQVPVLHATTIRADNPALVIFEFSPTTVWTCVVVVHVSGPRQTSVVPSPLRCRAEELCSGVLQDAESSAHVEIAINIVRPRNIPGGDTNT
jgi:hypothetical protein